MPSASWGGGSAGGLGQREARGWMGERKMEREEGMERKRYLGCAGDVGGVAVEHGGVGGWVGGV